MTDITAYKDLFIERYCICSEQKDVPDYVARDNATKDVTRVLSNFGYKPAAQQEILSRVRKEVFEEII